MSAPIHLSGKVGGVTELDAARLSAVALRANTVLALSPLKSDGSYRLTLPQAADHPDSPYALQVAVLPSTAAAHPDRVPNAPRATIKRDALHGVTSVAAPHLALDEKLIDDWSIFWREWCVSGTVVGPNGCPAPSAEVTVCTVSWSSGGFVKVPRATVTAGPDGSFALCFPWWELFFLCWPCEPVWWLCWPWWWERDILHVIDALETRSVRGSQSAALFRPDGHALIRGQGFAGAAGTGALQRDPVRTAQIARKFANPALREIFPWRWWCCDQPNIVFSVSQGGTTILAEDPSIDTRWCFGSGQTVTLTGNQSTQTICPGGPLPESGAVWTKVGATSTADIDANGLAQASGDSTDVAFAGSLVLHAAVAPGTFDYYQVNAAVWNAPAFRGGTQPTAGIGSPVAGSQWMYVYIYDPASHTAPGFNVQLGPFSANGFSNLYATTEARQNLSAPPGLAPFPPIPPGGFIVGWADPSIVLTVGAGTLLGSVPFGAVDLTLEGFDAAFNPVAPFTPDAPLTLTIDTTPLTQQQVNGITAWVAPGVPATQTGTGECPAYDVGPTGFADISVTVQDDNGFLFEYELQAQYGHGNAPVVTPPGLAGYAALGNHTTKSWVGGTQTITFPGNTLGGALPPDCCYEFRLYSGKRVTDGTNYPVLGEGDFQTISLKFSS